MKVLLALDGSGRAGAALRAVKERPWPPHTTIRVFTTVHSGSFATSGYDAVDYEVLLQEAENAAETVTKEAAAELATVPARIETAIRHGDPRRAILEEAKDWGADLIVLGSQGRTGLARALLGSVAGYVVRHAPCSVEVAREGHQRAA